VCELGLEDVAQETAEDLRRRVGVRRSGIARHVIADEHELTHAQTKASTSGASGFSSCSVMSG
jgi:hypothetical protein